MLVLPKSRTKGTPQTSWRQFREFDNHEFVIALSDKASGLKGFIAVHNRNLGIAHGGTRMKAYESETEALRDALNLSKAMSYKSALANLPYGGAKGVIIENPLSDRNAVLKAYAKRVDGLNGLFHTGTDVGLLDDDVKMMAADCRYMLGIAPGDKHGFSTSKTAALGVYYAIKAAAKHTYGSDDLDRKIVGIKGLGKLGSELARLLSKDGARLLLADIDPHVAEALHKSLEHSHVVAPDELYKRNMHIYAPCAFGSEFSTQSIKNLACDIIAGGANNQLVSEEAGDALYRRGILYVPDYVANAGGLIFVSEELESDGFNLDRIMSRLDAIPTNLDAIFQESEAKHLPTHRVAAKLAESRING